MSQNLGLTSIPNFQVSKTIKGFKPISIFSTSPLWCCEMNSRQNIKTKKNYHVVLQ